MNGETLGSLAIYGLAVFAIAGGMIGVSALLGERHHDKSKGEPYESGIAPTASGRLRVPVQYYLVAMLFVIFDLEAVYLYAWAIAVPEVGWLGFGEMAVFIGILAIALIYLWRVGALDWGVRYQRPSVRASVRDQKQRDALVAQQSDLVGPAG
jgi:NADH-quinone oxidoreductase subunit A